MPELRACRAVIVDDEVAAREAVAMLLADFPRVSVVGEASNALEAATVIRSLRPDLLFLDIQMPGDDGFRLIQGLGTEVPRGIVFVTAFDAHAARAFEHHALDYVVKPFGKPRFHAAVKRALDRLDALDALSLIETLRSIERATRPGWNTRAALPVEERADSDEPPARIGVRIGNRTVVLDVGTIDWIEACDDYARVHTNTSSYLVSERLQRLEEMLEPRFFRIHRSLLVNVTCVTELYREADGGGFLRLTSGIRLRVARNRWEELVRALELRPV